MEKVTIRVTERDLEIVKKEAARQQYELDEYLEKLFSEMLRPIRGKYAKAEMEENKHKWGIR